MTKSLPKVALIAALSVLSVPAFAEPDEPSEAPPATEETENEEKVEEKEICKRIAAQAGSRRKTKVCKTREEWKAYNEANRSRRY
ncbi:MAG: hypothetical protein AAFO28_01240 [Pseudomonadota bacterium]